MREKKKTFEAAVVLFWFLVPATSLKAVMMWYAFMKTKCTLRQIRGWRLKFHLTKLWRRDASTQDRQRERECQREMHFCCTDCTQHRQTQWTATSTLSIITFYSSLAHPWLVYKIIICWSFILTHRGVSCVREKYLNTVLHTISVSDCSPGNTVPQNIKFDLLKTTKSMLVQLWDRF